MNFLCLSCIIFTENNITQTKNKLDKYHWDSALWISMVKRWFIEFLCGRTSTGAPERSGRQIMVATFETFEKIHDVVLADRTWIVRKIVSAICSVVSILNRSMSMMVGCWLLLIIEHKRHRVVISKKCLAAIRTSFCSVS